ncbi:MAG TPA: type II toxin-antitoxin system HicA family toxin [Armatimonadota bacterium]|jgi:predicted RNA binding protein YcfA (HicA-like mRNA interferase family)
MDSNTIIRMLTEDGWYEVETHGSHHQFKHPTKSGKVTVVHPCKDVPKGTAHSILKQTGLK